MGRLLSGLLLILTVCSAYAQATEAPTEHASPLTVIVFIVMFVGSCVGYFAYIWWGRKKKK